MRWIPIVTAIISVLVLIKTGTWRAFCDIGYHMTPKSREPKQVLIAVVGLITLALSGFGVLVLN